MLCFLFAMNVMMKCRRFWTKRTLELFDLALGRLLGNCWPPQALMPRLPYGKMLEVIMSVSPLWRYATAANKLLSTNICRQTGRLLLLLLLLFVWMCCVFFDHCCFLFLH